MLDKVEGLKNSYDYKISDIFLPDALPFLYVRHKHTMVTGKVCADNVPLSREH